MNMEEACKDCRIVRYSAWSPSLKEPEPDISFTDSRFRRRLSMISRMTIRVIHDILPEDNDRNVKICFVSFRGELNQQFKINKMLIEEGDILPAAFSLSVFNTPPALAAMALNLTQGYSALYPEKNKFHLALIAAIASLKAKTSGKETSGKSAAPSSTKQLVLVYADEEPVQEYQSLKHEHKSLAFAVLLGMEPESKKGVPLTGISPEDCKSPENFLTFLETTNA